MRVVEVNAGIVLVAYQTGRGDSRESRTVVVANDYDSTLFYCRTPYRRP